MIIGHILTRKHGTYTVHNLIVATKKTFGGVPQYMVLNNSTHDERMFVTVSAHNHYIQSVTKPCQPIPGALDLLANIIEVRGWRIRATMASPYYDTSYQYTVYHNGRDEFVAHEDVVDGSPSEYANCIENLKRLTIRQRELHEQVVSAVSAYMDNLEKAGVA